MGGGAQDDRDLARAYLEGDTAAHDRVRGWVEPVVRCGSWRFADAEGVVQEVLVRLLTILRTGRFRAESSLKTFATSVARHACIDAYRRERYRGSFEADLPAEEAPPPRTARGPEDDLRTRERLERVMFIFQNLPEACRDLWTMVYGDGLTPAQVAERLGISGVAARVRVHRCLEKARAIGRTFLAAPAG